MQTCSPLQFRQQYHEELRRVSIEKILLDKRKRLLQNLEFRGSEDQEISPEPPQPLSEHRSEQLLSQTAAFIEHTARLPTQYADTASALERLTGELLSVGVSGVRVLLLRTGGELAEAVAVFLRAAGWREGALVLGLCAAVVESEALESEKEPVESADLQGYIPFFLRAESLLPNLIFYLETLHGTNCEGGKIPPPFSEAQGSIRNIFWILTLIVDNDRRVARILLGGLSQEDLYNKILTICKHRMQDLRLEMLELMKSLVSSEKTLYVKIVTSVELYLVSDILGDVSLSPHHIQSALDFLSKILDDTDFGDEVLSFSKMAIFLLDIGLENHLLRILSLPTESYLTEAEASDMLACKLKTLKIFTALTSFTLPSDTEDPASFLTAETTRALIRLATSTKTTSTNIQGEEPNPALQAEALVALGNVGVSGCGPAADELQRDPRLWAWALRTLQTDGRPALVGRVLKLLLLHDGRAGELPFAEVGGWSRFVDICIDVTRMLEQLNSACMANALQLLVYYLDEDHPVKIADLNQWQQEKLAEWAMEKDEEAHTSSWLQDAKLKRQMLGIMAQTLIDG